jgi:PAS domain S-box-containing protein/putative nucleotidyltransferase with HDIG domain
VVEAAYQLDAIRARKQSYDQLEVINALLQLSLEDIPLQELLQRTLDLLTTISWIALESKGSIFLVEDVPEVLVSKAQKGLAGPVQAACRQVPFGRCLCGLAASTRQIQFAAGLDDRHANHYEGMLPHGHYCVPILLGDRLLGVANLYLQAGHLRSAKEEEFLTAIANTLAGIVMRRESEEACRRSEQELGRLIKNVPAIVFKGYLDGYIHLFDGKVEELTGYAKAEFESKRLKWTDLILNDDLISAREVFIQAIKSGQPYIREYRIRRHDGKVIWVQERSHIVFKQTGKVDYISGVLFDLTERKQGEEDLRKSLDKLRKILGGTVAALSSALAMRDPYTADHQKRVTQLACAIGKELGFSEEQIEGMRMIGFLHDIGKIAVPAEILTKPGKINDYELKIIRTHAEAGYSIVKDIEFPCPVAEAIVQHHERLDGSGYPKGLSGSDIIIQARILAVADVVEAMASHRPYRAGLGIEKALAEISEKKGILYDPAAVDVCVKLFTEDGFEFQEPG